MSIALICDRCGQTFPEGQDGSASGTIGLNTRTGGGRATVENKRFDSCAVCNAGNFGGSHMTAIESGTRD